MSPDLLPIAKIKVGARHRTDIGDLSSLAHSIEEVGLLHPVVVTVDHQLVAGYRRLQACKSLGFDEVPVRVATTLTTAASLLRAERDENTCRKDFTPSEMVAMADRLAEIERPAAAERKAAGNAVGGKGGREVKGKLPSTPKAQTRDVIAEAVGTSGRTLDKASEVVHAAEDDTAPEPVRAAAAEARDEMDRTGKVDPAFRKVQQAKAADGTMSRGKGTVKPRRHPLPDIHHRAVHKLVKAAESVQRAQAEDRFPDNRDKIARADRWQLNQAAKLIKAALDKLEEGNG